MGKVRAFFRSANNRHWTGILALLAVSVVSVNTLGSGQNYLSSVASLEKQEPFDGTVMPLQKVPDWSNLSSGQNTLAYSELPTSKLISIPEYDNDVLTTDPSSLGWGTEDKKTRNALITYPVPYAGNYQLDYCGEGCGSHPAVDIKALKDTPVYAIANGVIEEASSSSSWGNYVVIKHTGVPNPDSPKQTTTLFSVYAHLDQLFVSEGKAISKGAVLGEVGDTGTATTHHLPFQLDNLNAPWHPYWPFTTAEASAEGYDFWDAVNYGVGQDNLYAYTENPMDFVQKYLDEDAVLEQDVEEEDSDEQEEPEDEEEIVEEDVEEEVVEEDVISNLPTVNGESFATVAIEVPDVVAVGEQETLRFYLIGSDGEVVEEDASFEGNFAVSISDSSVGTLNRSTLDRYAFDDGEASVRFYGDHVGSATVTVSFGGESFTSLSFDVISEVGQFDHFELVHDGAFVPDKPETIQVQALDKSGVLVSNYDGYGTVNLSVLQGSGSFSSDKIRNEDFKRGIAEVSFTANSDTPVILKFTFGLQEGQTQTLLPRLFNDFEEEDTYYEAVSYLYRQGTVQGYPDGTFQPARTVSRVEALKFIFSGLEEPTNTKVKASFKDTSMKEWYSPYLATASSLGVVEGYPDGSFKPTQGVNRVEFLKMLFSTVNVTVDPVVGDEPYPDVNSLSWYAPYVAYAKEKNIFPVTGQNFNPSAPMSRVEVAEVIYRLITVLDNGEESYSVLQKPSDY